MCIVGMELGVVLLDLEAMAFSVGLGYFYSIGFGILEKKIKKKLKQDKK